MASFGSKRFIVFGWAENEANGGWYDFQKSFEIYDEAQIYLSTRLKDPDDYLIEEGFILDLEDWFDSLI